MAMPLGLFDPGLRPEAWYDDTLVIQGWFDPEIIDTATGGATFVTGTDSNSATTESAVVATAVISGTDAGSSATQTAALTAQIPASDVNGTTTESATYLYLLSGSDVNGVTTELAARSAVIAATADAGAGSEVSALTAQIPSSDASGAGAQSATLLYLAASSDSGSGSETATVTVPIAASDNGSGSEIATMLFLAVGSDSGTASAEDVYFVKRQGFIDTGTATENTALVAQIPGSDSGTDSESGSVITGGVSVSGTDSGIGFDRVGPTNIADNFNRADSGSLGTGWTPLLVAGGMSIVSNEAAATVADHVGNYRNAEAYFDAQYAEITVTSTPVNYHDFIGPMVRAQNNGDDFYTVFYFNNNAVVGNEELRLYKRTAGSFGFLNAGDGNIPVGTLSPGDVIRVEAIGPLVRAYLNGVLKLSAWDVDHPNGGAPGVFAFGFSHLDNYKGGDLPIKSALLTQTDDFNRPDGANFGGSAKWQKTPNGAPAIASNRIVGAGSQTIGGAWADGVFADNQASQITGLNVPGGAWFGVTVRDMAPAAVNYLAIAYNAGPPIVNLYKQIGLGVFSQLGSSYTIPGGTISGSDVLRLEATGSTITAKYNGVTAVSVTDTTIPAGGAPGILIFDVASGDNWQGESASVFIPALNAAIPAADNNGATTEATTLAVAAASSDSNGATTESGSVAVGTTFKTDSDTGAGTEAVALTAVISATDVNGATVENGTLRLVGADSGTGSENASLQLTGTDSGSGSENAVVPHLSADTGSGSEIAAMSAQISATDVNGAVTENGIVGANTPKSDSDTDTNASVENATVLYLAVGSDSGAGSEVAGKGFTVSDTGSGTDAASRQGFYATTDAGTGSEASSLSASLTGADSGSESDVGSTIQPGVFVNGTDSGSGVEILSALARSGLLDTGTGSEAFQIVKQVSDSGTGVDSAQLFRALVAGSENGVGLDIATIRALLSGSDLGSDFENAVATQKIEHLVEAILSVNEVNSVLRSASGQKSYLVGAKELQSIVNSANGNKSKLLAADEDSSELVKVT